jgi:hypothetical protein
MTQMTKFRSEMENPVLDQPDTPDPGSRDRFWANVGYAAIACMIASLVMRLMHLNGSLIPAGMSLLLMAVRFFALMPRGRPKPTGLLYLAGHITLCGILLCYLFGILLPRWIFLFPAAFYGAGILVSRSDTGEDS